MDLDAVSVGLGLGVGYLAGWFVGRRVGTRDTAGAAEAIHNELAYGEDGVFRKGFREGWTASKIRLVDALAAHGVSVTFDAEGNVTSAQAIVGVSPRP